jgi:hypothetical protein
MAERVLKTSTALFLFATLVTTLVTTLGQSAASAASATTTGPTALAVAAVVARYSPLLSAYEKRLIAGIFDGNVKVGDKRKLSVIAETDMQGQQCRHRRTQLRVDFQKRKTFPERL